jgi:SAM-dependent methyltransferase
MISTWSRGAADDNMPESLLVATLECVRRHPWWQARAKLVLAALKQYNIFPSAAVVEVGCGWGTNMDLLEKSGYSITGLDISRRILEMIDRPDRNLVEMDLNSKLPATYPRFDVLLALDVIEHLDDDRGAISRMAALLRPGGTAIVSVPALPDLFSEYDEVQGHRRRYLPETLRATFKDTGMAVRKIFWWGAWMVPILRRTRERSSKPDAKERSAKTYIDYLRLPPWPIPPIMNLLYLWEQRKTLEGRLKTGTSLFAVAVKDS